MQWRELPADWDAALPAFEADAKGMATRDASGLVLNALAAQVPWLLGGAADLGPSTKTTLTFDFATGMALSGLRAYAASFFVFTDYARGAIRLAAMMGLPVVYVWTHDSIAMGEDGPTHQPVEQLASFRAMPGMVLTPQALPTLDRSRYASARGAARGACMLADAQDGPPDVLLASGFL